MNQPPDSGTIERGDRLDRAARAFTLHLLWLIPLLLIPLAFYVRAFHDLFQNEALAAAETAREIVRGHGLSTLWAYPIEIASRGGHFPRPEFSQAPLHPLVLALFFGALSASDQVAAGVSLLFLMATGLVLFRLADRAFGRTAATLAVVFLVLGLQTLVLAISGTGATMAMFLVTLAMLLLFAQDCSPRRAGAAGAVLSLAYLTDTANLAWVIPAGLFALYSSKAGRWQRFALFALVFVVVAAPWWIRNAVLVGDPFYTTRQYGTATFVQSEVSLYRITDLAGAKVWATIAGSPIAFARKMVLGLNALYTAVPTSFGIIVVAFFIAGILQPLPDSRARLLRKCVYLGLGLQLLLSAAQSATADSAMSALPLVLAFAAGFFVDLLRRLSSRPARNWATAVLIALAACPVLVAMAGTGAGANRSRENIEGYLAHLPPRTVVLTDVPEAVAWYAERPAVLLPVGRKDFEKVDKRAHIGAIYISYRVRNWPAQEQPIPWLRMAAYGYQGFVRVLPTRESPGDEALLVREEIAAKLPIPRPPAEGVEPMAPELAPSLGEPPP
jgi:4-amino-4-deoxy-L-arabinose transferase-like glycosyltransferase